MATSKRPATRLMGAKAPSKRMRTTDVSVQYNKVIRISIKRAHSTSPEEIFYVHEDIVCLRSPYILDLCSKASSHSEVKAITLGSVGKRSFGIYINWLYAGGEGLVELIQQDCDKQFTNFTLSDCMANLWILGDKLADTKFKNEVMDCLQGWALDQDEKLWSPTIHRILVNARPGSALRLWLIDHLVGIRPRTLALVQEDLSREDAIALLERINSIVAERRRGPDGSYQLEHADRCRYHEHAEGEDRCELIAGEDS